LFHAAWAMCGCALMLRRDLKNPLRHDFALSVVAKALAVSRPKPR
jgi:hypothetical protein